jgi:hypothetical protein
LEKASFELVRNYLSDFRFLIYYNPEKVIYIKIDTSNTCSFGIILFYLKEDYKISKDLVKISSIVVQSILFFSKLLSPVEKNYYLIELEVACLIYTYYRL